MLITSSLSNAPQHSRDFAQNFAAIAINWCKGIICWKKPNVTVFHGEGLHSCFAIDHGRDDLAFLATFLAADDDKVTVANSSIDHGIAFDLEHEELALAH